MAQLRRPVRKTVAQPLNNRSGGSSARIPLILASTSPRRRQMLEELRIKFTVRDPAVDERILKGWSPGKAARELARRKAAACAGQNVLVVAMDTVVVFKRQILGKPADEAEAAQMLSKLSDQTHEVISGLALLLNDREIVESETSRVWFRKISRKEIDWYIKTGEPMDKAGAYAIQGFGRLFVTRIEGCFYNVVGFPLSCFQRGLQKIGYQIADFMS